MTTVDPGEHAEQQRQAFRCPRCGNEVTARFYGPCETCRAALRAAHAAEGREVATPAYEPKMNVTPNAVALKE